ncbi:hypothetical protein HYG81_22005 (plasmid) [Natrinema zhouii]|uniref:hypothetical protein n=1 Tax=Natrinema zhouii TaxID=1710539 RepID=UPI001CFFD7A6|nr:hypothetical protein [Natrinema zhouii]UHQ98649.1 hypothetical protein HYG81_22005 [Natrinema zhouii]
MSIHIDTELEHMTGATDDGVAGEFTADETFDFHGEQVACETTVVLLEDGGVHITQATDQGTLTVSHCPSGWRMS